MISGIPMGIQYTPATASMRVVPWKLVGVVSLLVLAIFGIVIQTILIIQSRESDAVVIDLAGRQRLLHERHLKEILLVSQGMQMRYQTSRTALVETLNALTIGGEAISRLGERDTVYVPPAPNEAITTKLAEQGRLLDMFIGKADAFLTLQPGTTGYLLAREELIMLTAALFEAADDAVMLFSRHSESKIRSMVWWEATVALAVGLLGALLTWQMVRSHQALTVEIAERQRAEEELHKSQALTLHALRQSDTLKSSLLSSVSHELRTPLTAIKTMLFTLHGKDKMTDGIQAEFLGEVNQEIDYLDRLVDNLLDMSKIEAGTLVSQREWHVLEELVEGAIRRVGKAIQHRPLQVELADDLPPLFVDGIGVQQVLVNLLDNALKYSSSRSPIRIRASATSERILVQVSNTGEGIPPDELERIFERFYRVPIQRERTVPGAGLGLAICKGIIDAHGGHTWAVSSPGQETTIQFTLPRTPASGLGAAPPTGDILRERTG